MLSGGAKGVMATDNDPDDNAYLAALTRAPEPFQDRAEKAMQDQRRVPQPDRAAIEALARDLTDEDWKWVLAFTAGPVWLGADADSERQLTTEEHADLLAYLDEVWAGLPETSRQALWAGSSRGSVWASTADPLIVAGCWNARSWDVLDEGGQLCTPFGRAVLRRAKEQG